MPSASCCESQAFSLNDCALPSPITSLQVMEQN
jgi:hypothetical protein